MSMLKYLNDIHRFNSTNGKLNRKQILALMKSINVADLGPLAEKFKWVNIAQLKEGANPKIVICGKITWNLQMDDTFPLAIGFIDAEGTAGVLIVYNVIEKIGFDIGDSIAIKEPFVSKINFSYKNNECCFTKIRVTTPNSIIYNGKPPKFRGSICFVETDSINP